MCEKSKKNEFITIQDRMGKLCIIYENKNIGQTFLYEFKKKDEVSEFYLFNNKRVLQIFISNMPKERDCALASFIFQDYRRFNNASNEEMIEGFLLLMQHNSEYWNKYFSADQSIKEAEFKEKIQNLDINGMNFLKTQLQNYEWIIKKVK